MDFFHFRVERTNDDLDLAAIATAIAEMAFGDDPVEARLILSAHAFKVNVIAQIGQQAQIAFDLMVRLAGVIEGALPRLGPVT
ncbi:hypothetical protein XM25_04970 [Devosia sp. H5989]|nr:hypothetical protein XM25_04970 [Devosia sp. H5989]